MAKIFIRKKENFICEKCGLKIIGTGYTNHCSNCLWSKHVDINPGDRSAGCGGLMRPFDLEIKNGIYYICHQCVKCGHKKKNRISENDNKEEIIKLSAKIK